MNLTKPQQLVYDMERFSGGAIATICGSILLKSSSSAEEIQYAINKIIELNDALRIRVYEENGMAFQKVSEYSPQEIEVLHFESKDDFNKYAEKLAKEPMDVYSSLFYAVGVIVGDEYGVLVKIHHLISDAWTLSLLGTQFSAIMNGEDFESYSYTDYIETENKYLESKRFQKDKDFWLETFKKCDEPTYLSDVITKSVSSNRLTFVVDREKTKIISDYATETQASMYSVLMTAVAVYFNRVKNNLEKFYIGTAVLNRNGQAEKNTIGMFINTVPVLIELDNCKTFEENMEFVTASSLAVFRHQRFNYGDILKTIREEFKFDEKLYDVIFSYQNAKITGVETESQWYHCGSQNESLQIHIDDRDNDGVLRVHYDYNTDKFSKSAIKRMHGHIFNLLFDAIDNFEED